MFGDNLFADFPFVYTGDDEHLSGWQEVCIDDVEWTIEEPDVNGIRRCS